MSPTLTELLIAALSKRDTKALREPMWAEDIRRGLRPGFQDGYDYWNALAGGVRRGADGHMGSRNPLTGLLLKSPQHETFWKTLQAERAAGYEVYVGKDGRLYSRKKPSK